MKSNLLLTVWVCAGLFASCGGGDGDLTDGSKTSALSACSPSSGPVGTKVVCAAKGIEEDSTLFFGKSTPIEYTVEEESVLFTVTAGLPGERQVFWQSESGVHPIGTFNVTAAAAGDGDVAPTEPTTPSGDEGEVIAPSGPAVPPGPGGEAPPPDADGDGVADASDACPGTVSGTAVDGTGCPPPPPTPTGAEIVKFNVAKSAASGAALMTFHVEFEFVRAKEAYVWGNLLNRTPSDGSLAAAEQCKIQGDRSLRTSETGAKLNPGTDPYTKLPVEGVLCDNTNCRSSSSSARLDLSPKDGSRFNDPLLKKDLYGIQSYQMPKGIYFEQAQPDKMIAVAPGIFFELAEKNPSCRFDLEKDGTLVTSGDFYTRSHAQYGKLCLVLLGEDDAWKVQCVTGDALKAPKVAITASSVSVIASKMALKLMVDYSPGTSAQVTGCTKKVDTVPNTGKGHYEGECAINALNKTIDLTVNGVGENNKDKRTYTIELGSPTVTLVPKGTVPLESEPGNFKVQYKAVRNFTIKEGDSVLQSGEASWFKKTYFEGFTSDNGYKDATAPSEFFGDRPVTQDMSHNEWWFGIKDFDGHEEFKKYTSPGFPKTFTTKTRSGEGSDGMVMVGTETFPLPGFCSMGIPIRLFKYFDWEGQNIKSITIEGDGGIDNLAGLEDKTGFDAGSLRVYKVVTISGPWSIDPGEWEFKIVATHHDGSTTKRSWSLHGWSCN